MYDLHTIRDDDKALLSRLIITAHDKRSLYDLVLAALSAQSVDNRLLLPSQNNDGTLSWQDFAGLAQFQVLPTSPCS